MYRPEQAYFGGYTPNDGTIEFYGRIKALARPDHVVLDYGAGRAAWFEDDKCEYRRQMQLFKGFVKEVIAADIDEIVMTNRSSDRNLVIGRNVPLPDSSVDIVIADYVLEHVENPVEFSNEVFRLLKPSGLFCARTPHKYSYVAIGARMIPNRQHVKYLKGLQPDRKSQDVFPTCYRLNTLQDIKRSFPQFDDASFVVRTDPAYFFGSRAVYKSAQIMHQLSPSWFSGNIFAFLRKKP